MAKYLDGRRKEYIFRSMHIEEFFNYAAFAPESPMVEFWTKAERGDFLVCGVAKVQPVYGVADVPPLFGLV
jgi:hypothetical protein